jgi:HAD superfamily hydrolase (TIGR01509 family)
VPEPSLDITRLKAVIFDLDGTLYRQGPLRRAMAMRLVGAYAIHPAAGLRAMRTIAAYRQAQEHLRSGPHEGDLAEAQIGLAVDRTGFDRVSVARDVARWIEQEPLDLLSRYARPGLRSLLASLRSRGIKLAVLSDYEAAPKLHALGIIDLFDVVLCAQEPEVGVFKPDPRGLQVALKRLDVTGAEALYVGDRADVDAVAAAAAGVPCAIFSKLGRGGAGRGFVQITRFSDLQTRLEMV